MIKSQTILIITYPNGASRSIATGKDGSSFRVRSAGGKVSRIGLRTTYELIEEFDRLCNEGQATLTLINEEMVAGIRRYFS